MKKRKVTRSFLRSRCRICGRYRYLMYLKPSLTQEGKWVCQSDLECVQYYKFKYKLK